MTYVSDIIFHPCRLSGELLFLTFWRKPRDSVTHGCKVMVLESVSDWTLALNNGQSVMVAYVDYAKAFDVVCHKKLLSIIIGLHHDW